MNEKAVLELCFELAQELMWEHQRLKIEDLPGAVSELSEMTSNLVEIVRKCYYYVENHPEGDEIMLGAIKFLSNQAIPPLRGNYLWFNHSLAMLLEICCPICGAGKKDIPFLLNLQRGIIGSIERAIKHEENDTTEDDSDNDYPESNEDPTDSSDLPF